MNFNKYIRVTLACSVLLAVSCTASALPFGDSEGEIRKELQELRTDLGLSREQKSEIRKILMGHREEIRAQRAAGQEARDKMKSATETHGPDSAEVDRAADGISRIAKTRALLVSRIFSEIRPVLTPEQIQKLEATRTSFLSQGP